MSNLPLHLFEDLQQFIHTKDRFEYLRYWLRRCCIDSNKIEIDGQRHLLIRFSQHQYDQEKKTKIFVAHYNCVKNSPGANNNSAAVFQLLCLAGRISQSPSHHNIQILFTDGSDPRCQKTPNQQSSYRLSIFLKSRKISNCIFYVFDMCGIGDSLIVGKAGLLLLERAHSDGIISDDYYNVSYKGLEKCLTEMQTFDEKITFHYGIFSDDLGFLLGGYPSICFFVLPHNEMNDFKSPWIEAQKENHDLFSLKKGNFNPQFQNLVQQYLPSIWKNNDINQDIVDNLEKRSFSLIEKFLSFIVKLPI